jgi:hypothetical protein
MSELIEHWAESLEIGDRVKATIRHETDGSKNHTDVPVIVVENYKYAKEVKVKFMDDFHRVPYNELSKLQTY